MSNNLRAQVRLAPKLYAARANEQYGDPAMTRLGLNTFATSLFGGQGQQGLMDLYGRARPQLQQWERDSLQTQRSDDIEAILGLSGRSREALRTANPESAAMLDLLNEQAVGDLRRGTELDPREAREAVQTARGLSSSRGFGQGSENDQLLEALGLVTSGQALQDRRRGFAGNVLQGNQAFYGDPFQQVLGRPSQTTNQLFGLGQQGAGAQRTQGLLNPESAYGQDLRNTNFNADAAARIASANNSAAITGAAISAAGSVGSSL